MANLIIYGSLMNKNEIDGEGSRFHSRLCVRVGGHQRIFNLPTTFKKTIGNCKSVLNVWHSDAHWLNAVLMTGVDEKSLKGLDRREDGYTREKVPRDMVEPLHGDLLPTGETFIYVGEAHRIDDSILPIPDYLGTCLAGALHWGGTFYDAFTQTTYVNGPLKLAAYLSRLDSKLHPI